MLITYSFTATAVTVRRWAEVGPDATSETGARVELDRHYLSPRAGARPHVAVIAARPANGPGYSSG